MMLRFPVNSRRRNVFGFPVLNDCVDLAGIHHLRPQTFAGILKLNITFLGPKFTDVGAHHDSAAAELAEQWSGLGGPYSEMKIVRLDSLAVHVYISRGVWLDASIEDYGDEAQSLFFTRKAYNHRGDTAAYQQTWKQSTLR